MDVQTASRLQQKISTYILLVLLTSISVLRRVHADKTYILSYKKPLCAGEKAVLACPDALPRAACVSHALSLALTLIP
jgi:hypothetical protein